MEVNTKQMFDFMQTRNTKTQEEVEFRRSCNPLADDLWMQIKLPERSMHIPMHFFRKNIRCCYARCDCRLQPISSVNVYADTKEKLILLYAVDETVHTRYMHTGTSEWLENII